MLCLLAPQTKSKKQRTKQSQLPGSQSRGGSWAATGTRHWGEESGEQEWGWDGPAIFLKIYLFSIYFRLHWVFVAARGGYSSLWCVGFSLQWLLLLQSMGSRCASFNSCGMWAQ